MSRLRVHNFVVTLDGYASGEDQSPQVAFGNAQAEFLPWFEKANIFRPAEESGAASAAPSVNESIAAAWSGDRCRHHGPQHVSPHFRAMAAGRLARMVGRGTTLRYAVLRPDP